MENRSSNILKALIQEFIAQGEPISSGYLYRKYDFGIKPAMIRAELSELANEGYLDQPYPSAGRVPTDKAYKFFARQFVEKEPIRPKKPLQKQNLEQKEAWRDLIQSFVRELNAVNVAADRTGKFFIKEGLSELIAQLEWESRDLIQQVVKDFEALNEEVVESLPQLNDKVRVFVGRQSPVTSSDALSVVIGEYSRGTNGESVTLMVVGPKRMDYRRTITTIRGLLEN